MVFVAELRDKVKEDEMDKACSMNEGKAECI
jgi:hypothetical protein